MQEQKPYAVILARVNNTDIHSERLLTPWHVDADIIDVLYMPPSHLPVKGGKLNIFVHSVVLTFLVPVEEINSCLFLLIYRKEFAPDYSEWPDAIDCIEVKDHKITELRD